MQYIQKSIGDEVDFLPADKHKSFLQVDSITLGVHTQSNKFTVSLQYLKENVKRKVYFLPADKHQRFLQIDTITLGLCVQTCPNYPK